MRDYYVHLVNFTENELIIDYVHESREINYLFHESREYFRSRITGNNFVLSRFAAITNEHSRFTKTPFPTLFCSVFLEAKLSSSTSVYILPRGELKQSRPRKVVQKYRGWGWGGGGRGAVASSIWKCGG